MATEADKLASHNIGGRDVYSAGTISLRAGFASSPAEFGKHDKWSKVIWAANIGQPIMPIISLIDMGRNAAGANIAAFHNGLAEASTAACCSAVLAGTKRIVGRATASQIASASAASFLFRLT